MLTKGRGLDSRKWIDALFDPPTFGLKLPEVKKMKKIYTTNSLSGSAFKHIGNFEGLPNHMGRVIDSNLNDYEKEKERYQLEDAIQASTRDICTSAIQRAIEASEKEVVGSGRATKWWCVAQYITKSIGAVNRSMYHQNKGGNMLHVINDTITRDNCRNILKAMGEDLDDGIESELVEEGLVEFGKIVLAYMTDCLDPDVLSEFTSLCYSLWHTPYFEADSPDTKDRIFDFVFNIAKTSTRPENIYKKLRGDIYSISEPEFVGGIFRGVMDGSITPLEGIALILSRGRLSKTGELILILAEAESTGDMSRLAENLDMSPIAISHTKEREECEHSGGGSESDAELDDGKYADNTKFDFKELYVRAKGLELMQALHKKLKDNDKKNVLDPFGTVSSHKSSLSLLFRTNTDAIVDDIMKTVASEGLADFPEGTSREIRDWYYVMLSSTIMERTMIWVHVNHKFKEIIHEILKGKEVSVDIFNGTNTDHPLAVIYSALHVIIHESLTEARFSRLTFTDTPIPSSDGSARWESWVLILIQNRVTAGGLSDLLELYENKFFIETYEELIGNKIVFDSYIRNMKDHNMNEGLGLITPNGVTYEERLQFEIIRDYVLLKIKT